MGGSGFFGNYIVTRLPGLVCLYLSVNHPISAPQSPYFFLSTCVCMYAQGNNIHFDTSAHTQAEYLALCDVVMETVTTNCSVFIAFGLSILFFGPILFIVVSLMRLLPYIHKQPDAYTERETGLSFAKLRSELSRQSLTGKIVKIHAYYIERQDRGDWNEDLNRIGFWFFLIGSVYQ